MSQQAQLRAAMDAYERYTGLTFVEDSTHIPRVAAGSAASRRSRSTFASSVPRIAIWRRRPPPGRFASMLEDMERAFLARSLREHDGNLLATARTLGVARSTLYRRIAKYGLATDD